MTRCPFLLLMVGGAGGGAYSMEPAAVIHGLAVYRAGKGDPVFLMPYPHASARAPMIDGELAQILVDLGRSVITFDPPGMFRSTRAPRVSMEEMLGCARETLAHFGIAEKIDFAGHSMGSFCALAFSLDNPRLVNSLVLVGSTSGWDAVNKWGIHRHWKRGGNQRREFMWMGVRLFLGLANLEIHKRMSRLIESASFVDKRYVREIVIDKGDRRRPAPPRSRWPAYLRREDVDYRDRLHELDLPVLICVGRYDPQTPVVMNQELHQGIRGSQLSVFQRSGHSPFIEEPEAFRRVLGQFWGQSER